MRVHNTRQQNKKSPSNFVSFVNNYSSFLEEEKEIIIKNFSSSCNQRAVRLAVLLVFWSMVGSMIDSVLIGGGVFFSFKNGLYLQYFVPELIFFVVNFILKSVFIFWYMRGDFSYRRSLYCATPYLDSFIVLGCIAKDSPLLAQALKHYLNHVRKRIGRQIFGNKKPPLIGS